METILDSGLWFVVGYHHVFNGGLDRTKAAAQVLQGLVTDSLTEMPLSGVRLSLQDQYGIDVVTTSSDGTGLFRLVAPEGGQYRLTLASTGYSPLTSQPFHLGTGQTQDVRLTMTALPHQLEPIEESATPTMRRPLEEFWERREKGVGSFITRAEFLEQGSPREPTDVLRRMSGIRIYPATGQAGAQRFYVRTTRGRSRSMGTPLSCAPLYFIDGRFFGDADATDIDGALSMEHLEAVEVYGSAVTVPTAFNRPGATCGVIVFWTR